MDTLVVLIFIICFLLFYKQWISLDSKIILKLAKFSTVGLLDLSLHAFSFMVNKLALYCGITNNHNLAALNNIHLLPHSCVGKKSRQAWLGSLLRVLESQNSDVRVSSYLEALGQEFTTKLLQVGGRILFLAAEKWSKVLLCLLSVGHPPASVLLFPRSFLSSGPACHIFQGFWISVTSSSVSSFRTLLFWGRSLVIRSGSPGFRASPCL